MRHKRPCVQYWRQKIFTVCPIKFWAICTIFPRNVSCYDKFHLRDTSSSVVCIVLTGVSSCCDTAGEGDELRQPGQDEETTGVLDQQSQRRAEEGASRCPPSFLLHLLSFSILLCLQLLTHLCMTIHKLACFLTLSPFECKGSLAFFLYSLSLSLSPLPLSSLSPQVELVLEYATGCTPTPTTTRSVSTPLRRSWGYPSTPSYSNSPLSGCPTLGSELTYNAGP